MCTLFSGTRGSFLALSSPGHPGGPLVHWAQVWVSGGHRSACSGRSKSRTLASNRGVAFRGDSAEQDHGKPTCSLPYSMAVKDLYFVAANSSGTPSLCGRRLTALSACGSHGFFLYLLLLRSHVVHRPSSSQAFYFVTALLLKCQISLSEYMFKV